MVKNWNILPKISDDYLKRGEEYSPLLLQLLFNRGLTEKETIKEFLEPDHTLPKYDFNQFKMIDAATDLIISHIKNKDKIIVYGDYDADGVTSAALLFEILKILKAEVEVYIPDRVSEGYGLNSAALQTIALSGAKLLITVDNGIRNRAEVLAAQSLGLDIIITDHHTPPEKEDDLPACLLINPKVRGETYPEKFLAGVGVALKLILALIGKAKLSREDKLKLTERCLDLVAVGTVADCVPLLGENRALVKKGLAILNKNKRLGLSELVKAAGLNRGKSIDAWNIGFQIAPRLNAAGRMGHANISFELLTTKNKEEAVALANRLSESNIDRQQNTDEIFAQVEQQIIAQTNENILIGIYKLDESLEQAVWNEGVIGLVAGKICEKYYKPALVITAGKDGYKGSGRSIEEFNLIKALNECAGVLDRYGGHPLACGFGLLENKLPDFSRQIKAIAKRELKNLNLQPQIAVEVEIDLAQVGDALLKIIKQLEPFGQNNERPKFLSRSCSVVDKINMGLQGQHIKFRLKGEKGTLISAIGFGQAERWQDIKIGDKIDIVYHVDVNEYNGRSEMQLKIVDIKIISNRQ